MLSFTFIVDSIINETFCSKIRYSVLKFRQVMFPWLSMTRTGLTQTAFRKKADASDSASETVKREFVEAREPRRPGACCVSPTINETSIEGVGLNPEVPSKTLH